MNDEHPVRAFDPLAAREVSRRDLPHWRQDGVLYFVTFRLGDALPAEKLSLWRHEREEWLRANPRPHTATQHRQDVMLWDQRINRWLHAGHGSCCLSQSEVGTQVELALQHFDGNRYLLGNYVVMPNHVHALVLPMDGCELSKILHSWKSFTAHEINRLLRRSGPLWQDEYFDHIVRDDFAWEKFSRYVQSNAEIVPGRAISGLGQLGVRPE